MSTPPLTPEEFLKVEMRAGTIIRAQPNEKARKPAYVLEIDCGELGTLTSSAQVTGLYEPGDLEGLQVVCVTNFPYKRIAGIKSECLVLGASNANNDVALLTTQQPVDNGSRIH